MTPTELFTSISALFGFFSGVGYLILAFSKNKIDKKALDQSELKTDGDYVYTAQQSLTIALNRAAQAEKEKADLERTHKEEIAQVREEQRKEIEDLRQRQTALEQELKDLRSTLAVEIKFVADLNTETINKASIKRIALKEL